MHRRPTRLRKTSEHQICTALHQVPGTPRILKAGTWIHAIPRFLNDTPQIWLQPFRRIHSPSLATGALFDLCRLKLKERCMTLAIEVHNTRIDWGGVDVSLEDCVDVVFCSKNRFGLNLEASNSLPLHVCWFSHNLMIINDLCLQAKPINHIS